MMGVLRKTFARTLRFLSDSLAWRGAERPYALVGWGLLAGLIWIVIDVVFSAPGDVALVPVQLVLLATLAAVCAIDSRFGIIPDSFVLALGFTGLMQNCIALSTDASGQSLLVALLLRGLDAAIVFAAAEALRIGYRRLRGRDGLGFGDVKFFAAATLWTGLSWTPLILLVAVISALGSIAIMRHDGEKLQGADAIAFGPHLALGVWLAVLASGSAVRQISLPWI